MTSTLARGRWLTAIGAVLIPAAVALTVAGAQVSYALIRGRERTCDGLLPMPDLAYVLGWLGVGVALLALAALVFRLRSGSSGWVVTLLAVSVLVFLFAVFVVYTVYADAPTHRFLCSG